MQGCVVCEDPVTNPICPGCLEKQIRTWLFEVKPSLVYDLKKWTSVLSDASLGSSRCIICNTKMDVCPYCFTEHILEWLIESKQDKELLTQFLTYFNFDLKHKGYELIAEKLGLI